MGDTPAPAISNEAIYKTAEMFKEDSPRAAELLTKSSYVDDLIDSFKDITEAQQITSQAEAMLSNGGFKVKCWQFSGKEEDCNKASKGLLKGTKDNLRVLGLGWRPEEDVMIFQVTLNFSQKRKGQRTGPNLDEMEVPASIPTNLTRRMVLEQVMAIYDPLGLLIQFTLQAKVYLRETWKLKLGWDDAVPSSLQRKWMKFFQSMFEMEDIKYERCLRPSKAVGKPSLVILSDGSNIAYGCAAYILWTLEDGNHWLRLIMAKSRIAPINRLSTPQMELNGAVMSKRARATIEKEMRFDFERVFHLVDSETVLNMINKTSTRFKVYEGVRLDEIQASANGDMSSWAWISGENNIADWLTRGRSPSQLTSDSEWWRGPDILYRPIQEWSLKFGLQQEGVVPGEKKLCSTATVLTVESLIDSTRFSSINRVIWVIARLQNMFKYKSFKGGKSSHVTGSRTKGCQGCPVYNP